MVGQAQQATVAQTPNVATITPGVVAPDIQAQTQALQAAQGQITPQSQITAQQQLTTSVSGMEAAQGTATIEMPLQLGRYKKVKLYLGC